MMKIAIVGANGYIARNLIYVLKRDYQNYEIYPYGIESNSADQLDNYVTVDMTDRESVKKINLSCDIVFMLVGKTGSANGFDEYDSFININQRTLLNLLNEYRRQKSKARIVFPSTRLVYKGSKVPQGEDAEKKFKTVYAVNKFACEKYLEQFCLVYGVKYTVFRICIPYGTMVSGASSYGTAEFMLAKASKGENITIYGDGQVRRTLTHMEDLCTIMIKGAFSEKCENDVFNIGGEDYSLIEMARLIAEKYAVGVDLIPWPDISLKIESGDTVFDSSKLDSVIEVIYKHSFKEWATEY